MGRWGEELFAGDTDMDEIYTMSEDAGIQLYYYEIEAGGEGKGLEATRTHLNNGVLDRLFKEYAVKESMFPVSKELRLVFLGAVAMRLGATISRRQMQILRRSYLQVPVAPKYSLPLSDTSFRRPAFVQFETAIQCYKNDGTPWNFDINHCKGPSCGKTAEDGGRNLMVCARCRAVFYCGRECQAADWAKHKTYCKPPAKNPRPMLLNV